jgi:membrane associated rhomboid family serine protease
VEAAAMLILGDQSHHHGRIPWVTGALIVANVAMYLVQVGLGERFTNGYSLVPREITEFRDLTKKERVKVRVHEVHYDRRGRGHIEKHDEFFYVNHYPGPFPIVLTLITSMFLHANPLHLIGNMWFLVVFGRNVECALNHGRFIVFYLLCGVVGGLAHVAGDPSSVIPCLGASGAISGVLGAYVAIHPLNMIKCYFGWWFGLIELPALLVIGVWFLFQYLAAFMSVEHPEHGGGVAYWAHLGGFLAGVSFIWCTILYLKWDQAKATAAVEDVTDEPALKAAPEPPSDPFASFLPPTGIQAGAPKPAAPTYEPVTSFEPDKRR